MAKENEKMEGAASQADLNKANALAALRVLANLALQLASQQQQEVQNAAGVLERVIHDAGETWSTAPAVVEPETKEDEGTS
jgi:hypothetical protein